MPPDFTTTTIETPTCEIDGCQRHPFARGLCTRCYQRARKRGLPPLDMTTWKIKHAVKMRAVHASPDVRAKMASSMRATLAGPEARAKWAAVQNRPEVRERRAAGQRAFFARPEFREQMVAASRAALLPEARAKRAATDARPEVQERRAAALRAAHARPEVRAKRIAARASGRSYRDTSIELALQRALTDAGIPYEKQKNLIGTPDLFVEPNICIFADGDYWHGPAFPKTQARDAVVTAALQAAGYTVLRFGESEIHAAVARCLATVRLATMFRMAW